MEIKLWVSGQPKDCLAGFDQEILLTKIPSIWMTKFCQYWAFLQTVLEEYPTQTAQELAKSFNKSYTSVTKHLYEYSHLVPHCLSVFSLTKELASALTFLVDTQWILSNNIQRKRYWKIKISPQIKTAPEKKMCSGFCSIWKLLSVMNC